MATMKSELDKAHRMLLLAVRHDNTRRLALLLAVLYVARRLARLQRKRAAADRFMSELLARESQASRVQSAIDLAAYGRQQASQVQHLRLPRSSSKVLLSSMVKKHVPEHT